MSEDRLVLTEADTKIRRENVLVRLKNHGSQNAQGSKQGESDWSPAL